MNLSTRGIRLAIVAALPILAAVATQGRAEQPLTAQYEKLRANEKQAELWARISEVPYPESGLPTKDPGLPVILKLFLATYLWPALLHTSDELPEGRTKLIHPFGSVAKVYFNVSSDRFTGLFASGGVGFLRISYARYNTPGNFVPGTVLKIMIDGRPSINIHGMPGLDGQGDDKNVFDRSSSNILQPPKNPILKVLMAAFNIGVKTLASNPADRPEDTLHIPLLEAAQEKSDGTIVPEENVNEPYEMVLQPTKEAQVAYAKNLDKDMRAALAEIPAGTTLYDVYVRKTLEDPLERIGSLETQGPFVASCYGDEKLFFQHMRHRHVSNHVSVSMAAAK